jgi:predicted nucleic acid-binding protein
MRAVSEGGVSVRAPDFIFLEIANALSGYVRRGSMTPTEVDDELERALRSPLERIMSSLLARQAFALAYMRGISVYDAAYLALATGTDSILVTADRRLAAEAERSALLPHDGPP